MTRKFLLIEVVRVRVIVDDGRKFVTTVDDDEGILESLENEGVGYRTQIHPDDRDLNRRLVDGEFWEVMKRYETTCPKGLAKNDQFNSDWTTS